MTYKQLSNFTHDELANFTWGDLELDVDELLNKMKENNSTVPYNIVLKLQELCGQVQSQNPNLNVPKISDLQKFLMRDAAIIIIYLLKEYVFTPETSELMNKILSAISELF